MNDKAGKKGGKSGFTSRQDTSLHEIVLTYLYPRIDIHVSKTTNHLLKAPFCVHPKTGKVCVPLQAEDFATFHPHRVPTLAGLCGDGAEGSKHAADSAKYIAKFQKFVNLTEEEGKEIMKGKKRIERIVKMG